MSEFVYVTKVSSNLKKSYHLTFDKPYVELQGKNAAGKTGVVQSIMLALAGSIRDAGFRDQIKDPKMLNELASDPNGLWSKVELSDGTSYTYEQTPGGKVKTNSPLIQVHDLFSLTAEALKGSTEKLIQFLYEHFSNSYTPQDAIHNLASRVEQAKLSPTQKQQADAYLKMFEGNPIALWRKMKDYIASEQADIKEHQGFINYVYTGAISLGKKDIETVQILLKAAEERVAFYKIMRDIAQEVMHADVFEFRDETEAQINSYSNLANSGYRVVLIMEDKKVRLGLEKLPSGNHADMLSSVSGYEFMLVAIPLAVAIAGKLDGFKFFVLPDNGFEEYSWIMLEELCKDAPFNIFAQRPCTGPVVPSNKQWEAIWLSEQLTRVETK